MNNRAFRRKLRFFARARAGVRQTCAPPTERFATRFRPTLGGKGVAPRSMPEHGYVSYAAALAGAREFKARCVEMLGSAH